MSAIEAKSGLGQKAMRLGSDVWARPKLCAEGCEQNRDIDFLFMLWP